MEGSVLRSRVDGNREFEGLGSGLNVSSEFKFYIMFWRKLHFRKRIEPGGKRLLGLHSKDGGAIFEYMI